MSNMVSAPVLVLNQNYVPLNVCDVRRAVVLLSRMTAELLENGRGDIHTPSLTFPVPSVIRLAYMVKRPFSRRRLSRREVFFRDAYTCQYCGRQTRVLTLDHVVPRYRGGTHVWENVVSACMPCNHKKAGGTPKEAGMTLRMAPRSPRPNPYYLLQNRPIQEERQQFMPWAVG